MTASIASIPFAPSYSPAVVEREILLSVFFITPDWMYALIVVPGLAPLRVHCRILLSIQPRPYHIESSKSYTCTSGRAY